MLAVVVEARMVGIRAMLETEVVVPVDQMQEQRIPEVVAVAQTTVAVLVESVVQVLSF